MASSPRVSGVEHRRAPTSLNHSGDQIQITTPPTLEELPTEVKILILKALPDPVALNLLISSSPLFNRSYVSNRESRLLAILPPNMSLEIVPEIFYLKEARKLKCGANWSKDVVSLVDGYRCSRTDILVEPLHIVVLRRAEKQDLLDVAEFHSTVQDFTVEFCKKTLSSIDTTDVIQVLTKTETRRIHHAIYRFEIFSVLFRNADLSQEIFHNDDSPEEVFTKLFLSCFEMWEVEEIACIRDFVTRFYEQATLECLPEFVRIDLYEERLHLGYNRPSGGQFLYPRVPGPWVKDYAERFSSMGLEYLMKTIMTESCPIARANLMEKTLCPTVVPAPKFLTETLQCRLYDYEDFRKDPELKTPEVIPGKWTEDGANAAWHWATRRINEDYFEESKDSLRRQGYIMWDLSRLSGWDSLRLECEESIGR